MPRSSESVAALGGALAKAQAELVNPEKALTATVGMGRAGEGEERTFRYASLASGLDIVRKTLGQHEIATVQTTAVDQAAGLVNLTTMLVHASGQWIASDWPVCPISDLASPRRMGAALTYARRYALFTLVGIAGEDDLDAPDLQDQAVSKPPSPTSGTASGFGNRSGNGHLNKRHPTPSGNGYDSRGAQQSKPMPPSVPPPAQSSKLRERFIAELAHISSSEQAEDWALKVLATKNTLVAADAQAVEQAFEHKLSELSEAADTVEPASVQGKGSATPVERGPETRVENLGEIDVRELVPMNAVTVDKSNVTSYGPRPGIDKSVLALSEPKRHRNKEHLRFVAQQACLICGRTPSDPHHLKFAQQRALGRKVSDEFVVPLCRSHHRALHRVGNEPGWWRAIGIEPLEVASRFWAQSRLIKYAEPAVDKTSVIPARDDANLRTGNAPAAVPRRRGRPRKVDGAAAANGRIP